MHPPAGDSNARWLSKYLYAAKNYLFKGQLQLDQETIDKLEDFLVFVLFIYLPVWYMAPFLSESTACDLQLAKDLEWYKHVNQPVAEEIILKLQNHSWYLGPELSWTLLFSRKMSNEVKKQLAAKISSFESKWESRGIKLKGDHSLFTQKDEYIDVSQLNPLLMVDERTKAVMEFLDIPSSWLTSDEYEKSVLKVNEIPCVNDACERAVQMADFFNLEGPKTEDARQDYYLSIKAAREQPVSSLAALQDYYKSLPSFFQL